jgi:hypothetical protein
LRFFACRGTWSQQAARHAKKRKAKIREVQGRGSWSQQARRADQAKKKRIKNIQGEGQLDDRARRGNRRKVAKAGRTKNWASRLRKQ